MSWRRAASNMTVWCLSSAGHTRSSDVIAVVVQRHRLERPTKTGPGAPYLRTKWAQACVVLLRGCESFRHAAAARTVREGLSGVWCCSDREQGSGGGYLSAER